jgi:hypothetical protein
MLPEVGRRPVALDSSGVDRRYVRDDRLGRLVLPSGVVFVSPVLSLPPPILALPFPISDVRPRVPGFPSPSLPSCDAWAGTSVKAARGLEVEGKFDGKVLDNLRIARVVCEVRDVGVSWLDALEVDFDAGRWIEVGPSVLRS